MTNVKKRNNLTQKVENSRRQKTFVSIALLIFETLNHQGPKL